MSPSSKFANFEIHSGLGSPGHRGAFRMRISGIEARISGAQASFEVKDISATGCSLEVPPALAARLRAGRELELELLAWEKSMLSAVKAKIVRVAPEGEVACAFRGLTVEQEAILDKLILEMQKRAIRLRQDGEGGAE